MSQQINLYIEESGNPGQELSAVNLLQGVGAIVFCALVFYAYTYYQANMLERELEASDKNFTVQQNKLNVMAAELSRQHSGLTAAQELAQAEVEVNAQREIINALKKGVIGNTGGYSEYMQAFAKQVLNGLWLTGFSIDGDATQMKIGGAALSPELVPAYINRLSREKIMRGKTFASLQMQLSKVETGKPETGQYLEFVLQSVAASEAETK